MILHFFRKERKKGFCFFVRQQLIISFIEVLFAAFLLRILNIKKR